MISHYQFGGKKGNTQTNHQILILIPLLEPIRDSHSCHFQNMWGPKWENMFSQPTFWPLLSRNNLWRSLWLQYLICYSWKRFDGAEEIEHRTAAVGGIPKRDWPTVYCQWQTSSRIRKLALIDFKPISLFRSSFFLILQDYFVRFCKFLIPGTKFQICN